MHCESDFMSKDQTFTAPVSVSERHLILDVLRGFALLGIIMANFPEFSLYSFLGGEAKEQMSTFNLDRWTNAMLYLFVDGKFYTIFSLLFGVGFYIILTNVARRGGNGLRVFYRRMVILFFIGLAHLFFLWSGDILMLYAIVGMVLPLFRKLSDKTLTLWALFFLLLPVGIDFLLQATGGSLSEKVVEAQWVLCDKYGITENNFAYWLRDADSYGDMFKFLVMGSVERMTEFIDGNRYFKVLGLFLIGFMIGRNRLYAGLSGRKHTLRNICILGLGVGLPLSALYAWESMNGHPWGLGFHSLIYFVSVYLTSFGYVAAVCMLYIARDNMPVWRALSFPGRMALTCYIGQSVAGIIIFYGVGMGVGASVGLFSVEIIALGVYLLEVGCCGVWLRYFRFGPLEWIWRCLTYGRRFSLKLT